MELKAKFDVTYMEEAILFLESLPEKVRDKIVYNISKSRYFMDKELFKKLSDVIATHGFVKKTQKTPESEIAHADALRKNYYNEKKK